MKITLSTKTCQAIETELAIQQCQNNRLYSFRLQAILMISWGNSLENIATFCQRSIRTLYHWLSLFITRGIKGLKAKTKGGRLCKLRPFQKKRLAFMLNEGPLAHGFESACWESAMIQELILRYFGVDYATGYIPQLLKGMGFSYKKMDTISHKADPLAQREWEEKTFPQLAQRAIKEGAVIYFEDESTFRIWSKGGRTWAPKGQAVAAKVHMGRPSQQVFGAIELQSGRLLYSFAKEHSGNDYLRFLKYLVSRNQTQKIYLIVDNGPIHKGPQISSYLEKNRDKIEVVKLPAYSPKFNPIEKCWKKMKKRFHSQYIVNYKDLTRRLRCALQMGCN